MADAYGENMNLNKPIFIVGLHRTGSTLLKNMLNLNRNIAMATDEMDFSDPWHRTFSDDFKEFDDLNNDWNVKKLVDFIYTGNIHGTFWKEYGSLDISQKEIFERVIKTDRSLKNIITILLDEYRLKEKKVRVGVKYPLHFSRINILCDWYPDCKIIFLTRDPRAICASKVNDEETRRRKKKLRLLSPFIHYVTLLFFILEYNWSARVYQKYKNHSNFYKIRYEDLIINPDNYIKEICDFCEVGFYKNMLNAFGKPSSFTGKIKKGVNVSRVFRWEKRLHKFDKCLITFLTKKSMKILGYGNIEKEYLTWKRKIKL